MTDTLPEEETMERSKVEKLAFTLEYLVKEKLVPGLLPKDVTAAAELLREQERELAELRSALAAKSHVVTATAEREHYRMKVRGTFVITDPRIFYGEIEVDDRTMSAAPDRDWDMHVARQLTRVATAEWIRDLEERAFVAVRNAIAAATGTVET